LPILGDFAPNTRIDGKIQIDTVAFLDIFYSRSFLLTSRLVGVGQPCAFWVFPLLLCAARMRYFHRKFGSQ